MTSDPAIFPTLFEALGFTLLHSCWEGVLIAGAYAAAIGLAPGLRPGTRYVLGLTGLLATLAAAVATFGYELARLSQDGAAAGGFDVVAGPRVASGLNRWLPLVDALWLTGVAVLSLRMAGGLWLIRKLSAEARDVPDAIRRRFDAALERAGLTGRVRVRLNARIDGPFVVGLVRAVVYLPLSAVTVLTPDQLDAVFAHELEHVRRADYAWNLAQTVIETLFFYHPAVWWIGKTLREQRELCCDDVALAVCRDPVTYATALLNLEEQRRAPHPAGNLAMALNGQGSGRSLLSRISRILGDKPQDKAARLTGRSTTLMPVALPVVLLTAAAFLLPMSRVAAAPNAQPVVQPTPARTAASASPVADSAGADESPAPAATDADVAPDENTWRFVRDAAQAQASHARDAAKAARAQAKDAASIARIATDAHMQALAELSRHQADIQRDIAEAQRVHDTARQQALEQVDMAKIQAEIQRANEQMREAQAQIRVQATFSEADRRQMQAEIERATAQARAEAKDSKAWKDWGQAWGQAWGKAWSDDWNGRAAQPASPVPAAPAAPAAPQPLPAPRPDPHPMPRPAPAPHPAAMALPAAPASPATPAAPAAAPEVVLVNPVTAVKAAKAVVAKPAKVEVKIVALGDGNTVRLTSVNDKLATVVLKGPSLTIRTRTDVNTDVHTVTE